MIKRLIKNKILHVVELIPFGRDLFLVLTKGRRSINYRGFFDTFEQARRAASCKKVNNYDIVNASKASSDLLEKQNIDHWFHDDDYPLLFWLTKLFCENSIVLELGGSLGHFFYSMQKYTTMPNGLRWTIAELPEAVNFGRTIAQERMEVRLSFVDSNEMASTLPVDIFLTAGTLQYMDETLFEIVENFTIKPDHILVHDLPVHVDKSFCTLQDLGLCEVPYRVYSQAEIFHEMDELGYDLIAKWHKSRSVDIPFHGFVSIEGYFGFFFKKKKLNSTK
jgi:putative methyltransferase (TIGR04325 family)